MRKLCLVLTLLGLAMCGGKSDNSVNPQTPASNLSVEGLKAICDWEAGVIGGYNHPLVCDAGAPGADPGFHIFDGPIDQASCVANFSAQYRMCPVSMEQVESCLQWSIESFCIVTIPMPAACATYFAQCKG
jgi:hypothetical protein